MITRLERKLVELTRAANSIGLVINPGDRINEVQFSPMMDRQLAKDIAIALQSYYTREEKRQADDRERQRTNQQGTQGIVGGDTPYGRPRGQR